MRLPLRAVALPYGGGVRTVRKMEFSALFVEDVTLRRDDGAPGFPAVRAGRVAGRVVDGDARFLVRKEYGEAERPAAVVRGEGLQKD